MCEHVKVKVIPQQAEVAQGVPGSLRLRIFLTFGTTRVVGRQPYAPAAFTPGEIPGTHFQRLSRTQGTWFLLGEPRKKIPSDTTGNFVFDPGTVRLVAQCLNHYATPGPVWACITRKYNERKRRTNMKEEKKRNKTKENRARKRKKRKLTRNVKETD